ncbi:uncharacterized protein LOC123509503 [Portunus trituberculatus]|uniref:uncharacterized protein LOC123509503 n=1 Tax=Portunus trituberculatus TaxID=210409 RepID=UPI001E1CB300|nr:uncharacterized protein LOC123509503 [Portunus trituberculatus]
MSRSPMVVVVMVVVVMVAMVVGDPISQCEFKGQLIADGDSCTRYHTCVVMEDGQFVTQISTCADGYLYDLVSAKCIKQKKGYVQDPESCVTFYGCHRPSQGGEGLTRRHYRCPGELRFHPLDKRCTYKVYVPDALCASRRVPDTRLGQRTTEPVIAFSTPLTTSSPDPSSESPNTEAIEETTITTTASPTTIAAPVSTDEGKITRRSKPITPRPAGDVSDLERITRLIKDQLLERQKEGAVPASSRD